MAPIRELVQTYEDLAAKMAEDLDPADMQKVMDRMDTLQHEIDAKEA